MRRPGLLGDLVGDRLAAPREPLLQRRLEVDRVRRAPRRSARRRPRRPPPPCARSRRRGSRRRSPPRAPRPARARSRRPPRPPASPGGAAARSSSGSPSSSATAPAGRARDRLRADLRQPAGAEVLGLQARIEVRRHRQREHAVAQERQARVGVAAARGPRGVREDLPVEVLRQPVEQFAEERQRSAAWERTKSMAAPTVWICAASSSEILTP